MEAESDLVRQFLLWKNQPALLKEFDYFRSTRASAAPQELSPEILQHHSDELRKTLGLYDVGDFDKWLREFPGATHETYESLVEFTSLEESLAEALLRPNEIEEYFNLNRWRYSSFAISKICLVEIGLAEEVHFMLKENPGRFEELALKFSVDEASCKFGGNVGILHGAEVGPEIQRNIESSFSSGTSLMNPIFMNNLWTVIKIHGFQPAVLDISTKREIRMALLTGRTFQLLSGKVSHS